MSETHRSYFVMTPPPVTEGFARIPEDVRRVDGCNCGGRVLHRVDCTLNDLPEGEAERRIVAADQRVRAYVNELP